MDDVMLVKSVAAQYLKDMGPEALRYLREMQEIAADQSDAASAQAWRDIGDAAHAMLPGVTLASIPSQTQAVLGAAIPAG